MVGKRKKWKSGRVKKQIDNYNNGLIKEKEHDISAHKPCLILRFGADICSLLHELPIRGSRWFVLTTDHKSQFTGISQIK